MPRTDAIARAFLRYLYEADRFRPEVAAFLDSPHAAALAPPPERAELTEAVQVLTDRELISPGHEQVPGGLPLRAGLTGSGLICVNKHDGDLVRWDLADQDLALQDSDRPETAGPRPVWEVVDPEPATVPRDSLDGLARVARVALLALPTVHARYGEEELVQRTARNLWEATRAHRPDAGRVRTLAAKLRGELSSGSMANTLGVVLLDSLDEAVREAQIPGPADR